MKLIVDNVWTRIAGYYERGLLDPVTSYQMDNYWFADSYRKGLWDGRIRFVKYDRQLKQYRFPTGFFDRVVSYLHEKGQDPSIDDQRTLGIAEPSYVLHDNKLGDIHLDIGRYSFQGDAIGAAITKTRGIIHMPTGAGKTTAGAGIIKSIALRTVWLTHRLTLLYQTQKELQERLQVPVGIIGDSECNYQDVTVAMVQTCANRKHDDFLSTCGVVIGDEIHHLESDQWFGNFASIQAPWRFGLTATPKLTGVGMNLLAMTGPIIYAISPSELIIRKVLVPPRIWIVPIRHPEISDKAKRPQAYTIGITENTYRNQKIVEICQKLVVEKKSTLVLTNRIAHGKFLTSALQNYGLRAEFIQGSVEQSIRDACLKGLENKKVEVVVAMASILGEGVDLPRLNAVVNATGTAGGGTTEEGEIGRSIAQFLGRGCRSYPGKFYFDFIDFADMTHSSLKENSLSRISTFKELGFGEFIEEWDNYRSVPNDKSSSTRDTDERATENIGTGVQV